MNVPRRLTILETTLRDGSYAINFQFTAADTAIIAEGLQAAGFDMIEIGHGVGLHGSEAGKGQAAETDAAYCEAAASVLSRAKFGMFCIPGIARLEDIDMAASYGMGFIRVGTDVNKIEESQPFIERAKRHGMYVAANLMKSYAFAPASFAKRAALSASYGVDVLYIVDSSGGMLPTDVDAYCTAVREETDVALAFHGHNNLGLAMANTMRAIEHGATLVDSSLQGFGRSSGNAVTEIVVAVLERMGIATGIDLTATMDVGETYVRPLFRRGGHSSLDITAGFAQFHSSYMPTIGHFARRYRVDPRKLIVALCEVDKVDAEPVLVEMLAKQLRAEQTDVSTARYGFDEYVGDEQRDVRVSAETR
jgi:4-hydroxy 2-oxovalerate aldolase